MTTDFLLMGGRYVDVNSEKGEFYFMKKPNVIFRYRLNKGELEEMAKFEKPVPIHGFHVTDRVLQTVSNNLTIKGYNVSSATIFDLQGKILYNRDFKKVQELKIIHNKDGWFIRFSPYGFGSSVC